MVAGSSKPEGGGAGSSKLKGERGEKLEAGSLKRESSELEGESSELEGESSKLKGES